MFLLSNSTNKMLKSFKKGYLSYILHLAPHNISGYQVCGSATKGCIESCLFLSGLSIIFRRINEARIKKTKLLFEKKNLFFSLLIKDIQSAKRKANKIGLKLSIRLNGTSDLKWEKMPFYHQGKRYNNIFCLFPEVQFYDYTKHSDRFNLPKNYHLTFSMAECNEKEAMVAFKQGLNVAVVFDTLRKRQLPDSYKGIPVIDGDDDDLRFLDSNGVIVGLRAKAKAKKDTTGFVKRVPLPLA
jgi:hypothetical protein